MTFPTNLSGTNPWPQYGASCVSPLNMSTAFVRHLYEDVGSVDPDQTVVTACVDISVKTGRVTLVATLICLNIGTNLYLHEWRFDDD